MSLQDTRTDDTTAMGEALIEAGVVDETPHKAFERLWKGTDHDPVETMRLFNEWAIEKPERMLGVLGVLWHRIMRSYLERDKRFGGSRVGAAFARKLCHKEKKDVLAARTVVRKKKHRERFNCDERVLSRAHSSRTRRLCEKRKRDGIKLVPAEVSIHTGSIIRLIDKEYGPFAHIRINGLNLAETTTEQALRYCDIKAADVAFIRALCHLIPDPRKPIGEQWTADMIREAKEIASRGVAA